MMKNMFTPLKLALAIVSGCFMNAAHAVIPNVITTNYTVSANDVCNGNLYLSSGLTLTVTNGATATFNGIVYVQSGAKLIFTGASKGIINGETHVGNQPNARLTITDNSKVTFGGFVDINNTSLVEIKNGGTGQFNQIVSVDVGQGQTGLSISSGATGIFQKDVTIFGKSVMEVVNATAKWYPAAGLILRGYQVTGTYIGYVGGILRGLNATFTCADPANFWKGIETMHGLNDASDPYLNMFKAALVYMDHCRLERAVNAITNYWATVYPSYPAQTSGGAFDIRYTTFYNNVRSLKLYYDHHATGNANGTFNPNSSDGLNWNALFQYDDFIIDAGFNPSVLTNPVQVPTEMVYLYDCNSISFLSCRFLSSGNNYGKNMAGIFGASSSVKVQRYFYNTSVQRGEFKGLGTGIAMYNNLETNKIQVILNCDFDCQNSINLSGCLNPYIVNNKFLNTFSTLGFSSTSVYLRSSSGYKVEGNMFYQGGNYTASGIVVNNSGVAYNEIYRNEFEGNTAPGGGLLVDIQSIGRNRDQAGLSGLKILCNTLRSNRYKGMDISVMKDPSAFLPPGSYHGIHRSQYVTGDNTSAGNIFDNSAQPYTYARNYYVQAGTNDMNTFRYGYQFSQAAENPSLSNLNPTAFMYVNPKNCGVKILANMPPPRYPFDDYHNRLSGIESEISAIEQKSLRTATDSARLEELLIAQASLIDSTVAYYQYTGDLDSIALVYEQVTKGYQYQLYLASAYREQGKYNNAIDVLNNIRAQYDLDDMASDEVAHLVSLYRVMEWLEANNYDWASMPDDMKALVHDYEHSDFTSAGAVARALMVGYEGAHYNPEYLVGEGSSQPMSYKIALEKGTLIYPNPADGYVNIRWDDGQADLLITDLSGKVVLSSRIGKGINPVEVKRLTAGLYFIVIQQNGKTMHQEKMVKK